MPGASLANVAILRGSLTDPKIAIVAVDNVLRGRTPDVRLEPGVLDRIDDIVAPGTNVNPQDAGWAPSVLTDTRLRRRPRR